MDMFKAEGFDFERLSQVYESRAVYNLNAFQTVMKDINNRKSAKFKADIQELF